MKKLYLIGLLSFLCANLLAQQQSIYSQYIFNLYAVNPAYAGERDALSAALSYRAQWVGFEGAPKTQNFSIHSPLPNNKMAIGLIVQNDEIGARSTPSFMGTYSYKLKVNRTSHVSLGLQGGFLNYQYHWDDLDYRQSLDPVAFGTDGNKWVANFDFGAMYITPKAYVGISVLSLNSAKTIPSESSDARLSTSINFIAGKMYKLNHDLFLKPSTIVRAVTAGQMQFDLNLSAMYKNKFWLTTTYRYEYGAVVSAHMYVNDNFHFGYAYDIPLNGLLTEQSGTHELFIGYDFNIYNKKSVSARNF